MRGYQKFAVERALLDNVRSQYHIVVLALQVIHHRLLSIIAGSCCAAHGCVSGSWMLALGV